MAKSTIELIQALRVTAHRLTDGVFYAWGNHGACNCGNLLQVITDSDKETILRLAQTGQGEWRELALGYGEWTNENQQEYCQTSGFTLETLFSKLAAIGLTAQDIHDLEYLENKAVLHRLPGGFRYLQRNIREDVVVYFNTFADILEEELLSKITLPLESLAFTPEPML